MKRLAGQAARQGGRLLHALAQVAIAVVVIAAVALGGAAWRLSRGPLEVAWLVPVLQAAVDADAPVRLTLGGAALAWEGFRAGLDQPLDIRLTDVALSDPAGRRIVAVPRATVALSPGALLLGRLVPRAIELDGAHLHVLRSAGGALGLDVAIPLPAGGRAAPDLPLLLREVSARPNTDRSQGSRSRWSQLRRVRIGDAALQVTDRRLGIAWTVPSLDIDLRRHAAGGISGTAAAVVALGGVTTHIAMAATLDADAQATDLRFRATAIDPAAIADALPPTAEPAAPLAALAAVEAPVALSGDVRLGPDLAPGQFTLTAELGAGTLHVAQGITPLLAAQAVVQGTPARLVADLRQMIVAPRPDGPRTTISGHAEVTRTADAIAASASFALDRVAFADLPALWPPDVGRNGTRPWIVGNITDGTAHDFHVALSLTAPPDLSRATLTQLSGGGAGSDVTVHWLRPVPPIVHGAVQLNFLGPDSLEVVASAGRETIGHDAIVLRGGRVVFSGLTEKVQFADITAELAGPVPAALALLGSKRIGLLDRSPIRTQDAAGQFAGHIAVTHLRMRDDVGLDELQIRTALKLTDARLPGIVAGRDLDHGTLDLTADPDGLQVAGQAILAGIPAQLQADMDFRAGPPAQVLQTVSISGSVDAAQLATLGLDAAPYATGTAQVSALVAMHRDRTAQVSVTADLAGMALMLDALAWRKPPGQNARAEVRLTLDRDRIAGVESVEAEGEALHFAASATFADGRPDLLRIDHLVLGTTTDARGTVRVPAGPGEPWRADLTGRSLDVSAALRRQPGPPPPPRAGPAYAIDARFDQVVLGPGRSLSALAAHTESDGQVMRRLDLTARTGAAQTFQLQIEPEQGGRQLAGTAADAGALLRVLDVVPDMQGGRLTLTGHYDDTAPGHQLAGRAEITDFRVRHAPALAKLLQAMTLYGLVDLMQGPGLGFSRLIAPFRLSDEVLELHDARAFSPSLGMTAKGQLDLARQSFDMQGTIVPAYFFNSLLGDLPVIGRLFSPERGGGVFAATYSLHGPLDDPRVSVNPLAALTPGFLRGLFGLLDRSAPPQ